MYYNSWEIPRGDGETECDRGGGVQGSVRPHLGRERRAFPQRACRRGV